MAEKLTQRQRFWFEHIRRAAASGETLKAYAQTQGISLSALYEARYRLSRRGLLDGKETARGRKRPAAFVPVQLEAVRSVRPTCRLRHVSGWVVECEGLPDPGWLVALLKSGGSDVAA